MTDFFMLMGKPFLACLVLTGIHAYLGMHVLHRGVIFVDLSLAQIAALGAIAAIALGFDVHSPAAYGFSLGATFVGAIIFALTRTRRQTIPQEAMIGIVYVVTAALSILILNRIPEGDEHIRHMLVGNILLVDGKELLHLAVLYGIVGWVHWRYRNHLILISTNPEEAAKKGLSVKKWDLLFYLTFGIVVTSSVETAGVLLVFSFLIIPAAAAMLFTRRVSSRLIFGWSFGTLASCLGISVSYFFDLPTGAAIVCIFGMLLILSGACRMIFRVAIT